MTPRDRDGPNSWENLQLLRYHCHDQKTAWERRAASPTREDREDMSLPDMAQEIHAAVPLTPGLITEEPDEGNPHVRFWTRAGRATVGLVQLTLP